MKNYEEMAQSVLKRRDIEIKRRRRAFLIGAPCAAAVLVGVVGIGAAVMSRYRGGRLDDLINYNYNPGAAGVGNSTDTSSEYAADSGIAEIATVDRPASSTAEIAVDFDPYEGNDIKILDIDEFNIPEIAPDLEGMTFYEHSIEELEHYYGFAYHDLELDRIGKLYPNWEMSHDKFGLYNVYFGGVDCVVTTYGAEWCDRNTLNYTTDSGALITVSVTNAKFEPVSKEVFTDDKPTDPSKYTSETAYDENGTPVGTIVSPIDPERVNCYPEPDEGISTVNGYEALIYRSANGNFLADLDMGARVRITAEGLSEKDFISILDEFTERPYHVTETPDVGTPDIGTPVSTPSTTDIAPDMPVETDPPVNDYTNPNAGVNDIKVLKLDEFKPTTIVEVSGPDDFVPYTLENLDSFYGLRFNRLGELYPNWKLSYDELGIYRRETNDGFVAKLEMYNTCNTLKYTTENGAEIEVAAQYNQFIPVSDERLTADKPVDIPKPEIINEYDENGNLIGQTTPAYDPTKNPNTPAPDEGVSTVNGYEALIYQYTNDDLGNYFLADLDMTSRVRIAAHGLSEEEFLEVLDNFTK